MNKELIDYFIAQTNDRFDKIDEEFERVDGKLEELLSFKWKIIGGSVILSVFATVIVTLFLDGIK